MIKKNNIVKYLNEDVEYLVLKKTKLDDVFTVESDELDIFNINNNILNLVTKRGMDITLDLNKFIVHKQGEEMIIVSELIYISIYPVTKKYPNLRAEIERNDLSYRVINEALSKHKIYIQDILNGKEDINLNAAIYLRNKLFEYTTMEYLFADKPMRISA